MSPAVRAPCTAYPTGTRGLRFAAIGVRWRIASGKSIPRSNPECTALISGLQGRGSQLALASSGMLVLESPSCPALKPKIKQEQRRIIKTSCVVQTRSVSVV